MKRRQYIIMGAVGLGIFLVVFAALWWGAMMITEIGIARNNLQVNTAPTYGLIILVFLGGLALILGGTMYGVFVSRKRPANVPNCSDAWVTARYGLDSHGGMYFDIDDPYDDYYRLYARLQFPDGTSAEFRLPPELYTYCAEGAFGKVEFDGDHIARFVPYVGERVRAPEQIDV